MQDMGTERGQVAGLEGWAHRPLPVHGSWVPCCARQQQCCAVDATKPSEQVRFETSGTWQPSHALLCSWGPLPSRLALCSVESLSMLAVLSECTPQKAAAPEKLRPCSACLQVRTGFMLSWCRYTLPRRAGMRGFVSQPGALIPPPLRMQTSGMV